MVLTKPTKIFSQRHAGFIVNKKPFHKLRMYSQLEREKQTRHTDEYGSDEIVGQTISFDAKRLMNDLVETKKKQKLIGDQESRWRKH